MNSKISNFSKESLRETLLQNRQTGPNAYQNLVENNIIYNKVLTLTEFLYDEFKLQYSDKNQINLHSALGLYWSIKGEPDLLKLAITSRWPLALPKILDTTNMEFIKFQLASADLEKWHNTEIMQPTSNISVTPKIILIPALAFSLKGHRLGFGYGYYDRYINNIGKNSTLIKIGICFHDNLLEDLPVTQYDCRMDYLITDKITIEF